MATSEEIAARQINLKKAEEIENQVRELKIKFDQSLIQPSQPPEPAKQGFLESVSNSPTMAFIDQLTRATPPAKIAHLVADNIGLRDKFSDERATASPRAAVAGELTGDIVSAIPQYMAGMGALKGIGPATGALGFLANLLKGAAVNTAVGQGVDIEDGLDPSRIPLDAALGAGGEAISGLAGPVNKGGKWLMNKALGVSKGEAKAALQAGSQTLGSQVYDRTILPHSRAGYEKIAEKGLSQSEDALQALLSQSKGKISASRMARAVEALKARFQGAGGVNIAGFESELSSIDDAVKFLTDQGDNLLSASEANAIKRKIYSEIQNKAYKLSNPIPVKTDILKAQARGLKEGVEKIVPQAREINKDLAYFGKLKDKTTDLAAKSNSGSLAGRVALMGLSSGAGAGAGYASGGNEGAITGALAPLVLGTPLGGSSAAQAMKFLAKLLSGSKYLAPAISSTDQNTD